MNRQIASKLEKLLDGRKGPSRWVTRERPKIDRIACPWLILRFVDPKAEFHFVPSDEVLSAAKRLNAIPYDIPGVQFTHRGDECSFDTFIREFALADPGLAVLALIVRGADTSKLHLAPEAPGLLAVSLGLSRLFKDDHEMLRAGLTVYDAFYLWASEGRAEKHGWPPAA